MCVKVHCEVPLPWLEQFLPPDFDDDGEDAPDFERPPASFLAEERLEWEAECASDAND